MYFETAKTIEQAKNLFRDLCKKLHPDTSGFDSQSEFIKMFNEFKNFKPLVLMLVVNTIVVAGNVPVIIVIYCLLALL